MLFNSFHYIGFLALVLLLLLAGLLRRWPGAKRWFLVAAGASEPVGAFVARWHIVLHLPEP